MARAAKKKKDEPTAKQEAFAQGYVLHGNASRAYREAYDTTAKAGDEWVAVEACRLLDNPKVSLRVAELRKEAEDRLHYGIREAHQELEDARALAETEKAPAAMVSATKGKMELFGLGSKGLRVKMDPEPPSAESREEWLALIPKLTAVYRAFGVDLSFAGEGLQPEVGKTPG